jgi:3-deoxy-manno-octulosonate cytidylyltransferase (CMP-KDO synthetase)
MSMKTIGIIPARYASTRFPAKPLATIGGVSMIQRVWQQASLARSLDRIVVATDDERIAEHVRSFGAEALMTSPAHPSGTDRCAEVLQQLAAEKFELVVNIQGDEPFIDPGQIELLCSLFANAATDIATLVRKLQDAAALEDPNVVKALFAKDGRALYFTRHPAPFIRGVERAAWLEKGAHFQHIGIYAYRADVLTGISGLPPGRYELLESLEQLRWLEAGLTIRVAETDSQSMGIDTPEDLARAEAWLLTQRR